MLSPNSLRGCNFFSERLTRETISQELCLQVAHAHTPSASTLVWCCLQKRHHRWERDWHQVVVEAIDLNDPAADRVNISIADENCIYIYTIRDYSGRQPQWLHHFANKLMNERIWARLTGQQRRVSKPGSTSRISTTRSICCFSRLFFFSLT